MRAGLRNETFKYIEGVIRSYKQYPKWIKAREEAVEYPYTPPDKNIGGGRSSGTSDPTAQTATRLVIDRELHGLRQEYNAVKNTMQASSPETIRIIEMYYLTVPRTKTWDGIAQEVGYSRRQCLILRDSFVKCVAELLGKI